MSSTDDDEYGDIADEDLIEALSQPSQTLPTHSRRSRDSTESGDEEDGKSRKRWQCEWGEAGSALAASEVGFG